MVSRTQKAELAELSRAERSLSRWRRSRKLGARIPESLWRKAVVAACQCGVSRTAQRLSLSYYSLQRRVEQERQSALASEAPAATFVELTAPLLASPAEYSVELENASGSRMRVCLKGGATLDLTALVRDFWSAS